MASENQTAVQNRASLKLTTWARRWNRPRSSARKITTHAMKQIQCQMVIWTSASMAADQQPNKKLWTPPLRGFLALRAERRASISAWICERGATTPKAKKTSARRVSSKTGRRLRCSSVEDPQGTFSLVAPRRRPVFDETAVSIVFYRAARTLLPCRGVGLSHHLCCAGADFRPLPLVPSKH